MVADNADTRPRNGPNSLIGLKKIPDPIFDYKVVDVASMKRLPRMGHTERISHSGQLRGRRCGLTVEN